MFKGLEARRGRGIDSEVPPSGHQARTRRSQYKIPRPAAPSAIIKFHAPEIVFGQGSLAEAGFTARRLGAERPFVVTDPGIIEAGWTAALCG